LFDYRVNGAHIPVMYEPQTDKPSFSRRMLLRITFVFCVALILSGCMSLESMNEVQAEWDRKHAPGTGIVGSRLPQVVQVLATYEATKSQRLIAEARAREAQARMVQQAEAQTRKARESRTPTASTEPKPAPAATASKAPQIPKRIAVEVPHEDKKGTSTVMLWDTASEQLVGNEVYDLNTAPAKGSSLALWAGAAAQYVGDGS